MFPTTCTTITSLSEPAGVGDRHTMPARSLSVGGIPSRAIGFPGIMFATLGVSPGGLLGWNPYHSSPKVTSIPLDQISTPFPPPPPLFFFKFYFIFKLYSIVLVLPNIEMNLPQVYMCSPYWTLLPPSSSHLVTPTTRTLLPCRQYCSILLNIIKILLITITEKAMAPHSSTLAWKIPWMEESGRLQSTGSLKVGHDWATSLSLFTFMHWRRKWQPTSVILQGESQGPGSLVGCTESDTTEVT